MRLLIGNVHLCGRRYLRCLRLFERLQHSLGSASWNESASTSSSLQNEASETPVHRTREHEAAYRNLAFLAEGLKGFHMSGGRLAKIDDDSPVFDPQINLKVQDFYYTARYLISSRLEADENAWKLRGSTRNASVFAERRERDPLTFNSLKVVADYLGLSVQQRKLVRQTIAQQILGYDIWCMTLEAVVRELHADLQMFEGAFHLKSARDTVERCLQLLTESLSYAESPSWMKPVSGKRRNHSRLRWGEVFDLFEQISDDLEDAENLRLHVSRIEAMKEGLGHIKDNILSNNISLLQRDERESAIKRKLSQNLGHNSHCLFILLIFYFFQSVGILKVDLSGGLTYENKHRAHIYMGAITASADTKSLLRAFKDLHRALRLVKFIYETAELMKPLILEGHVWTTGTSKNEHTVVYRGIAFHLHGLQL